MTLFAADSPSSADTNRAANKAAVAATDKAHLDQYGADPDYMVRPGLLADRNERWVRIWGESIGMNTHDPVEFFLISEDSGHGYEALAVSFARPLDIHRALEFIGLRAGRPVNYDRLEMWPKGERVVMTFEWRTPEGERARARVEDLIVDARTGKPLRRAGLAFVGSVWTEPDGGGERVYAADAYDPQVIASDYNEELTVLDVPHKAVDSEVYGYHKANPEKCLPARQPLEILLEPEYALGRSRVVDLKLEVAPRAGVAGSSLAGISFRLLNGQGMSLTRGDRLKHTLAIFSRLTRRGQDPFVTVVPDERLTLGAVRELYVFLATIATDEGIRIEPPPEGHLFYRAFMPDEDFRVRGHRPSQPWELHLYDASGSATGTLVKIEEIWKPDEDRPDLVTAEYPAPGPASVCKVLEEQGAGAPVILVFAAENLTYGVLLQFIQPLLATHPIVYVFLPQTNLGTAGTGR